MGKTTIEWTDASWNPVTGCKEVSPGCANCYAARLAATRLKNHPDYKGLAILRDGLLDDAESEAKYLAIRPHWIGQVRLHPDRLEEPLHWKKPRKIFVCDMSDLFHEAVPREFIARVWLTMFQAKQHTFQVLTKRPARMKAWIEEQWMFCQLPQTPLPNVWVGTSVENQHFADERIPALLSTPAAVRFISAEPLLGPLFLEKPIRQWQRDHQMDLVSSTLDWVICGGESGPGARPMHPDWARSLRDQCQAAGVPFFFKQWGAWRPTERDENEYGAIPGMTKVGKKKAGRLLDGREWNEFPK